MSTVICDIQCTSHSLKSSRKATIVYLYSIPSTINEWPINKNSHGINMESTWNVWLRPRQFSNQINRFWICVGRSFDIRDVWLFICMGFFLFFVLSFGLFFPISSPAYVTNIVWKKYTNAVDKTCHTHRLCDAYASNNFLYEAYIRCEFVIHII